MRTRLSSQKQLSLKEIKQMVYLSQVCILGIAIYLLYIYTFERTSRARMFPIFFEIIIVFLSSYVIILINKYSTIVRREYNFDEVGDKRIHWILQWTLKRHQQLKKWEDIGTCNIYYIYVAGNWWNFTMCQYCLCNFSRGNCWCEHQWYANIIYIYIHYPFIGIYSY